MKHFTTLLFLTLIKCFVLWCIIWFGIKYNSLQLIRITINANYNVQSNNHDCNHLADHGIDIMNNFLNTFAACNEEGVSP